MRRYTASTRVHTEKGQKRKLKTNATPEAVQKINLKNAIWKLCVLLNANFTGGDYHLTLTYAHEPGKAEAKKDLDKLIRKMRAYYKKQGREFNWVAVTEYENKRIHHHIVCSRVDMDMVEKHWPKGWVNVKLLDDSGNYIKLAEYLIKETDKTFREDDSPRMIKYLTLSLRERLYTSWAMITETNGKWFWGHSSDAFILTKSTRPILISFEKYRPETNTCWQH